MNGSLTEILRDVADELQRGGPSEYGAYKADGTDRDWAAAIGAAMGAVDDEREAAAKVAALAVSWLAALGPKDRKRRLPTVPLDPAMCAELVTLDRWRSKVAPSDGECIVWTAQITGGYGVFYLRNRRCVQAHRVAYVAARGEDIPQGFTLDHKCRVRACVNPDHLEAVPLAVNTARGASPAALAARKMACINGHPLSGDNLLPFLVTRPNVRRCRTCAEDRARTVRAAARALGLTGTEYAKRYGNNAKMAAEILRAHDGAA